MSIEAITINDGIYLVVPPVANEIEQLRKALRLARISLEQGQNINGHIVANGPTIGEIINRALTSVQTEHKEPSK